MAGARRNPRAPVVEELRKRGYAFDFYQVVRLLEAMRPEAAPVGRGGDPAAEAVRFRSDPSLNFPVSPVVDVSVPDDPAAQARVLVSFLGIGGAQGPLPRPFTELVLDRVAAGDTAARDFLDIFNHRLVSLQYRAREKHRPGLRVQPLAASLLGELGFAVIGLAGTSVRKRLRVPDASLLFYGGALSHARRTAAGLQGILADHFKDILDPPGARVRIREFVGSWHELEPDQATLLGVPGGRCRLGRDAVLGGKVWEQEGMIEVSLGPLDLDGFLRFLPGGDALAPLEDLLAFYLRGECGFIVRPVLRGAEVPPTVLGTGPGAPRLGLTSWMKTRPFSRDADDVRLRPGRGGGTAAPGAEEAGRG